MKKLFSLLFALTLFGYSYAQDMGAVTVILPSSPMCPDSDTPVTVRIKNFDGVPINYATNNVTVTVTIAGDPGSPYIVVLSAGTLGAGITQNVVMTALADLSVVGTHTFTITVSVAGDTDGSNDVVSEDIIVEEPTITLTSAVGTDAQTVCVNNAITDIDYTIAGGATSASITAGALPAGVTGSLVGSVFTISGTPTTSVGSPFSYTITTSGGCTPDATVSGTITVTPSATLSLTSAVGTDAQTVCVNTAITDIEYTIGGSATSASITAGALPAGVTGSFAAGVFTISGTPSTAVGSPFSYTVETSGGCAPDASLIGTITVNTASTIILSSAVGTDAQTVCVNNAITDIEYTVGGGSTGASISAGALPAGVTGSFAAGVFTISGTPTTAVGSPFSYTITTSGGCVPDADISGTITVTPASDLTLSSAIGTDAQIVCVNTAITDIEYTIGGSATGASITAGALPAGVTGSFAAGVFTISGIPTTAVGSPFSYTVTTSGGCAPDVSLNGTITVTPVSSIALTSAVGTDAQTVCVNSAITDIEYTVTDATGASITAGSLPAGVTGTFAAGVFTISGTPTTAVGSPFSYTVTTSGGCAPDVFLSGTITVTPGSTIALTSAVGTDAQTVCVNSAIIDIEYTIGGSATSATMTAGALPTGVTGVFAAGVFTISGTPTTIVGSPFSYTITTSGGCVPNATESGTITVSDVSAMSLTSGVGTDAQTVCVNNAITDIDYTVTNATGASITAGALPAGVTGTFAAGVFTISGTPTTAVGSPFSYTVTTSGGCAPDVSLAGTITVTPAPTLTLTSVFGTQAQTVCINTAITDIEYTIGGSATSASITAGALPAGVTGSFAGGVFTISGTPTTAVGSPFSFTVTTSGGCSPDAALSGTITVSGLSSMSLTSAVGTDAQTVCVNNGITNIDYTIGGSATGASITAGALPTGVVGSFIAGVFTISGTPTTAVGSPFSYTVTTSGGCAPAISLSGTITVTSGPTIALTSAAGTDAQTVCINTAITDIEYTIGGSATSASITAGALPAGVTGSFAAGVFTISGTPTTAVGSPFSYTVSTSGGCTPEATINGTITVTSVSTISLTSAVGTDAQSVCINSPITDIDYTIVGSATGASITSGALPAGVSGSYIAGVFTISGTPTTAVGSPFSYTISTSGGCAPASTINGTITVNSLPTFTLTPTHPSACGLSDGSILISDLSVGSSYDVTYDDDAVPVVVGTFSTGAGTTYTITGLDAGSYTNFSITLSSNGCVGTNLAGVSLVDPGAPIVDDIADTSVCNGVYVLPEITGSLSGNESYWTGPDGTGTQYFEGDPIAATTLLYIYDYIGLCTAQENFTVTIDALSTILLTSAAGTDAQTICVNSAIANIDYTIGGSATGASITAGALPAGVTGTFAAGVITISGTPTTAVGSPFSYTISTSGGSCAAATISGTITVSTGSSVSLTSAVGTDAQTVCANSAISNINYTIGGTATSASITSGALPAGVTGAFFGGVFTISGTPTTAIGSPFSYTVTTSGGCAPDVALNGTITVTTLPTFTLTENSPSGCGLSDGSILISGLTTASNYDVTYDDDAVPVIIPTFSTGAGTSYTITGLNAGSYTNFSIALSSNGCAGTNLAGVSLFDPGAPIVDDIADTSVCNGIYTLLEITGTLSGNESYWTGPDGTGIQYFEGDPIAATTLLYIYDYIGLCESQENFTVTIDALPIITLSSAVGTDAQTLCTGSAITDIEYTIGGSATSASITVGGLPAGVTGTFAAGVFTISGTPTTALGSPFNYTVTTSGGSCAPVSLSGTITVDAAASLLLTSAVGTDGQTVCINTAIADITYAIGGSATGASITAGALPAGVTGIFAAGVFTISGTPTTNVGSPFSYTVTTSGGTCIPGVSLIGTIAVDAAPTNTLTSAVGTAAQTVCVNTAITDIEYTIGGSATSASVTAGGLPAGVAGTFAAGVFTISGTPTATGSFPYTVTSAGGACTGVSLSGTIIVDALPIITLTSVAGTDAQTVCVNTSIANITYGVTGGATGASITAGALPAGVTGTFAAGVFTISGTPTTAVGSPFSYTVTTSGGTCVPSVSLIGTIAVDAAPTNTLTSAVGTAAQTVCVNTAITDIEYTIGGSATGATITAGALPAGVTGTFAAGVFTISGTPTATGSFPYTVTSSGGACTGVSLSGTIIVDALPIITLTSVAGTDAQTVCINTAITDITYGVTGGATGASITAGALPAGVTGTFAAGVFTISGTPTTVVGSPFSYTITTSGGTCVPSVSLNGTITVDAAPINTLTSAVGTAAQIVCVNTAITDIEYTIGGSATSASITVGALPAGVTGTFAAGVFTISGTPTVTGPFSYTVTTSGGSCTSVSMSGTITVDELPIVTLTSAVGTDAQTLCENTVLTNIEYTIDGGATGASITSGALPAGVTGTFAAGIFTISGTPSTAVGSPFSYTVTTSGGTCVPDVSLIGTITVDVAPIITLTSAAGTDAQTICVNSPIVDIDYTIGGGATGASITAGALPAGVTGTFAGGVFTISGTPTTGVLSPYSFTVTTSGGACAAESLSGTLDIISQTIALTSPAFTNSQEICTGSSIVDIAYTVGGGSTGATISAGDLPDGVTGTFAGSVFTISGTPTETGTFFYNVTSTGACGGATEIGSITINPDLSANTVGADITICEGSSTTLTGSVMTGGNGTYTYLWESSTTAGGPYSPAAGVNNGSNYTTDNLSIDTYFIRTVSSGGCSRISNEVAVTVSPGPTASAGGSVTLCSLDSVTMSGASATNGTVLWTHDGAGTLTNATTLTPTYTPVLADVGNTVILTMTVTSTTACVPATPPTAIFTIIVNGDPGTPVDAGIDDTVSLGSSINLTAIGGSIVTWDWTPPLTLDNPFIYNPLATPDTTTTYVVTATHMNGCISTDSVTIFVENDFNLVITNALTPNGDGKNDTWKIQNIENYPNTEVIVINREGQIVFEDPNYSNNWDGKYNGKLLPDATYYYIVKMEGSDKVYKGAVTILRGK